MGKVTWKTDAWFYHNDVFVMIYKSEKGSYSHNIYGNFGPFSAANPFRTRKGAMESAKKIIDNNGIKPTTSANLNPAFFSKDKEMLLKNC